MAHVAEIYRYPVKGLSAEPLERTVLEPRGAIPHDRAYAIENGPSRFDENAPKHLPKTAFLMLMRHERLARLRTQFDDATRILSVTLNGETVAVGGLETPEGRATIEQFFDAFAAPELRGAARIVSAPGFCLSDYPGKVVSLINRETVLAVEEQIGRPVHPLRFRGNLYVDGLPAWEEFSWLDRTVQVGPVTLRAIHRIPRCAATNVDPETGARDLDIPRTLLRAWGHSDCGIYLEVVSGGIIATGDSIQPR